MPVLSASSGACPGSSQSRAKGRQNRCGMCCRTYVRERLIYLETGQDSISSLEACSMVSCTWLALLRARLFSEVYVSVNVGNRDLRSFTLLLNRSPYISPCVHALHMSSQTKRGRGPSQNPIPTLFSLVYIARTLARLSSIETLDIVDCNIDVVPDLSASARNSGTHLKNLILKNVQGQHRCSCGGIVTLLRLFSSLDTLELHQGFDQTPTTGLTSVR